MLHLALILLIIATTRMLCVNELSCFPTCVRMTITMFFTVTSTNTSTSMPHEVLLSVMVYLFHAINNYINAIKCRMVKSSFSIVILFNEYAFMISMMQQLRILEGFPPAAI